MNDRSATMLVDRAVLRVAGDDPRGFLQGLVTADLRGPLPVWAGLLTPQGKALFDFLVWADGEDLLLDAEAAQAEALARRLQLYRLRRAIAIVPEPTLAVHWARDGDAGVPDPRLPALGRRWLAPANAGAGAAPSDAGVAATSVAAAVAGWRAHRLSLGVVEGAAELGQGETLWLECNARELGGVSFAKGCYVGQENTARMHHRAKVARRLVVAPDDPAAEARVRYPDLGLMVVRRRVESLGDALHPGWLRDALATEG